MNLEHSPSRDHRRPVRGRFEPLLIPIIDAFEMTGVGRTKGYELIASGDLPTVMVGKRRYASREALEAIAERGVQTAATPAAA